MRTSGRFSFAHPSPAGAGEGRVGANDVRNHSMPPKAKSRKLTSVHAHRVAANGLWPSDGEIFDRTCTACPRLAQFLANARVKYPAYYCAPVAPFGDPQARLLIVGLAP